MTLPRVVTHIRGVNAAIDMGSVPETIWPLGGQYPWDHPTGTVTVTSDDGGDTQDVLVTAVDPSGDIVIETIPMGGTGAAVVQHVLGLAVEDAPANAGTVTAEVGGTDVAVILPEASRSEQAVYKLPNRPSRFDVHVVQWNGNVWGAIKQATSLDLALRTRAPGGPWTTVDRMTVHTHAGRKVAASTVFAPLMAGTDIEITAENASDNNMAVIAGFTIAHRSVLPNIGPDSQPFADVFGSRR